MLRIHWFRAPGGSWGALDFWPWLSQWNANADIIPVMVLLAWCELSSLQMDTWIRGTTQAENSHFPVSGSAGPTRVHRGQVSLFGLAVASKGVSGEQRRGTSFTVERIDVPECSSYNWSLFLAWMKTIVDITVLCLNTESSNFLNHSLILNAYLSTHHKFRQISVSDTTMTLTFKHNPSIKRNAEPTNKQFILFFLLCIIKYWRF